MKRLLSLFTAGAMLALAFLSIFSRALGRSVNQALFSHMARSGLILGANAFSKEECVAFDQVFEGFEDGLVISKLFKKYSFDGQMAERAGNTVWRPQPYIAQSFTGIDQSANFNRTYTQLSVPLSLAYSHSVPLTLSATELRDKLQEGRLGDAAMQRLASDINVDCSNLAALTGTVFVKRTGAASGFDDVAQLDNAFNRVGVAMNGRKACFSSADYNNMAKDIAGRQNLVVGKTLSAYEEAYVGKVAGFDTFKLDYAYRLAAKAGTTVTINDATAANRRYVPAATSTAATGQVSNVDNRYMNITIGVVSGTVKVGDAFTIAGVNEVHHITKQDTGQLKTFRITGIVSGGGGAGVVQISPPIIVADGTTDAEKQYANCTTTPANGAALTFLNTTDGLVNPFWQEDAFEIAPARYEPSEAGLDIMSATTSQGITVVMARQGSIGDLSAKYRWDVFYGLVNKQPQMTGTVMFSQA